MTTKPRIGLDGGMMVTEHDTLPPYQFAIEEDGEYWFTDNETNPALWNKEPVKGGPAYFKDAFSRALIDGDKSALNPSHCGTKATAVVEKTVPAGESVPRHRT